MESYKFLLTLHVATVIVGMGATFALPFLQGAAEKQGVRTTRFALEVTERIEKYLVIPLSIVLFVFGLGLIFDDATGYKDEMPVWLTVAITWFVLSFVVAVFVQKRLVTRALATLDGVADSTELPAAYVPLGKRMQMIGGLLGLSVVGITILMVWKPGA